MRRIGLHVRLGDEVQVISGGCKGATGKVIHVDGLRQRVFVQGVSLRKKYLRARDSATAGGGVVEIESPIHASNVRLIERSPLPAFVRDLGRKM